MPAETVSRPWQRFLCFSVRGLIVMVLVVGAATGWLVRSARIQRNAVAAIQKAGGVVNYDWESRAANYGCYASSGSGHAPEPWAPKCLVKLIGIDYFGHVTVGSFWKKSGSDGGRSLGLGVSPASSG